MLRGSADWLNEDLWRAHVSWLSPPWVGHTTEGRGDFDAGRWLDVMQAAGYRTLIFYVKHHDGFCAYPSRFSNTKPERDFLGECVAEVHKRDMRILCYYSSFIDEVTGNEHPDWQVLGRDGQAASVWCSQQWPGAYCCINNPGYRALVLGQLTELRDNYDADGLWMDVFEPLMGENCFCPSCQAKYRRETGGDIFETQGNAWYQECVVRMMGEIRDIAEGSDRACIVTANTGKRVRALDELCDVLTHEAFTSTMISSVGRALRPLGKPWEITCRLYSAVGTWAIRGADRVLLESMAAVVHGGACCQELSPTHTGRITDEAAVRVAEVGQYIRGIEEHLVGTEPVYDAAIVQASSEYGVTTECPVPGGWHTVMMERDIPFAFVDPDADFSAYRLVILDGRVPVDEALALKVTEYVKEGGSLIVEGEAGERLEGVLGVTGSHAPAPATAPHPRPLSTSGEGGTAPHPPAPSPRVEGGRTAWRRGESTTNYLGGLHPAIAEGMGADDLVVEGDTFIIGLDGAEALAYYRYEFASRTAERRTYRNMPPAREVSDDPAITLNRFGKGHAMFIACPLTTAELRDHRHHEHDVREYPTQLAGNLARFMIEEPLLKATTPAGIEVIVNRQGDRYIIHLLNHYAGGVYRDSRRGLLQLADVRVAISGRRMDGTSPAATATSPPGPLSTCGEGENGTSPPAPLHKWRGGNNNDDGHDERHGHNVVVRREGDWVEIVVPRLGVHAMIVLEPEGESDGALG